MVLRPYQEKALEELWEWFRANPTLRRPLVVAPTGSGKSILIAETTRRALQASNLERVTILSHRREILAQNAEKLIAVWPEIPLGIYSAGLQSRRTSRCTIAGIQSIYNKPELLYDTTVAIVDEAHSISPEGEGMYRQLLDALSEQNPRLVVIGFTATPYRMGSGLLVGPGQPFDDIASNISVAELVGDGYLAPLVSKSAVAQADLSQVRTQRGEFVAKDLELAFDKAELTRAALDEAEKYAGNRKSWLVFTSGVDHAHHVAAELTLRGITCRVVTGETPSDERDDTFSFFKSGQIRALVGCEVFSTGFDAPNVDCILLLRSTKSAGLYCQILGRAMRPFAGKNNALILDYGGNVERHGPIDAITIEKKDETQEVTSAPVKVCPECRECLPIQTRECACGYVFPIEEKDPHERLASYLSPMGGYGLSKPERVYCDSVQYYAHTPLERTPTLKAYYRCGMKKINEFLCFEHEPGTFPRRKASQWWRDRGGFEPVPASIKEALERITELYEVDACWIQRDPKNEKYWRIISVELSAERPEPVKIGGSELCSVCGDQLFSGPTDSYCLTCEDIPF